MQSDKVEMMKLIFVIKVHNIFVMSPVDCYLHITCDCILKHVFYICTECIVSIVEPQLACERHYHVAVFHAITNNY